MSTHEGPWPAGTPCWVDLSSDDLEASRAFYGGLFGWEWEVAPEEYGSYSTARLDGRRVAAIGRRMDGSPPAAWTTYLATTDAEATAAAVSAHGGTVVAPPMEIPGQGWFVVAADPAGAPVAFWQAAAHTGVEASNEPGAVIWNELHTSDLDGALAFYARVAGVTFEPVPGADEMPYRMMQADGETVGGMGARGDESPPGGPQWFTHFNVADADAAMAKAVELGATEVRPAATMPFGRWGMIQGPDGEVLALHQNPEPAA
ncbi:VOC family protein [Angustibacter aerolatus]